MLRTSYIDRPNLHSRVGDALGNRRGTISHGREHVVTLVQVRSRDMNQRGLASERYDGRCDGAEFQLKLKGH
jgi:hypothetical protein